MAKDYKYTDSTPVDEPVAKKTDKPKDASIMDKIRKYSPNQAAEVEESETATKKYGDAASKDFKEEKYGSAALNTAKGLGSAADTLLVKGPKAAAFAVRNRLVDGEKYAKGGSASSRADGCCVKGKTKGMIVGMNKGGMSC